MFSRCAHYICSENSGLSLALQQGVKRTLKQGFILFQLTGLPTTSGAIGNKEAAPKQAVADADADLQAR